MDGGDDATVPAADGTVTAADGTITVAAASELIELQS